MEKIKGLVVIYTGDGKGKTTAALGAALRAAGHGIRCSVIQFIKGAMDTGELRSAARLAPEIEIIQTGRGFTWDKSVPSEEHARAAAKGLEVARRKASDGSYGLVVLDEILYALRAGLVTAEDIIGIIGSKAPHTHLILTGRGAPKELIDRADLVTSMEPVKHPMGAGIPAQKGLDF